MTIRSGVAVTAGLLCAVLLVGCTNSDGGASDRVASAVTDAGDSASTGAPLGGIEPGTVEPFTEAVWLQDGASIVLLTYGSSTCTPEVKDLDVSGQKVTATFVDTKVMACTDDLTPRLTAIRVDDKVSRVDTVTLTLVGDGLDDVLTVIPLTAEVDVPIDPPPSVAWLQHGAMVAVQNNSGTSSFCSLEPGTALVVAPSRLELDWAEPEFEAPIDPVTGKKADVACAGVFTSDIFAVAIPRGLDLTKPVTLQYTGALDTTYELPALQ